MTDLVNRNQAIFDAIVAAITSFGPGEFNVNVKKFIETFNNHRDRALCTSLNGAAQTRCSVCGSGDAMVICEGCWTRRPAQAQREIDRLRRALELLADELPEEMHTLDEPDEDWEVIVKMRAIAREAIFR
jgi:hypothetical protein